MGHEVFPCKLYHVTSSFFLRPIRTYGLAGADGVAHWRMLEALQFLEPKAATYLVSDEWWIHEKGNVARMAHQANKRPSIFTSGRTIVCAADRQALDNAALYRCGCETLDYLVEVYTRLKKAGCPVDRSSFPVFEALECPDTMLNPVMITIENCPMNSLVPENESKGVTTEVLADRVVRELSNTTQQDIPLHLRLGGCWLRVVHPIPFEQLQVFRC